MIFDKNNPNFSSDDPLEMLRLAKNADPGYTDFQTDDMIDMSNPDDHPDWAKEVHEKHGVTFGNNQPLEEEPKNSPNIPELFNKLTALKTQPSRSPASLSNGGIFSDDEMADMAKPSKYKDPRTQKIEEEIESQEALLSSYRKQGINDSTQIVPIVNKIGQLKKDLLNPEMGKPASPNIHQYDKQIDDLKDLTGGEPTKDLNDLRAKKQFLMSEQRNSLFPLSTFEQGIQTGPNASFLPEGYTSQDNQPTKGTQPAPAPTNKPAASKDHFSEVRKQAETDFDQQNGAPDTTEPSENTREALANVQSQANNYRRLQLLLEGSSELGSGIAGAISGYKVEPTKSKTFENLAGQVEKDWKDRVEVEQDDPNSSYSKGFRQYAKPFLKKIGFKEDALDKMSGKQIAFISKDLKDAYDTKVKSDYYRENAAATRADRSLRQQELDLSKKRMADMRVETAVNRRFDNFTKDEIARIQGSDRAQKLIDEIKSNKLIASSNVRNLLTREVAQLAMPAGLRASVGAQKATEIDTAYGRVQDLIGKIAGHPRDSIPAAYVSQLEREIQVLKDKYKTGLQQKVNSLKKGTKDPYAQEIIEGRASEFLDNTPTDSDDEDIKAINWARQNPNDPRAKQILQLHGL